VLRSVKPGNTLDTELVRHPRGIWGTSKKSWRLHGPLKYDKIHLSFSQKRKEKR